MDFRYNDRNCRNKYRIYFTSVTITELEETHVEINTVPIEETLNHIEENKLDEDVAKVYESISITVQENLEKIEKSIRKMMRSNQNINL